MPLPSYALGGTLMRKYGVFVVTDELQQVLDNLPPNETRSSRLEPFRASILLWRREGRSYRKIQHILAAECRVQVTYETLRRFVKLRSKPRKPKAEPECEQVLPEVVQQPLPEQAAVPTSSPKLSPQDAAQKRPGSLRSFRNKPALAPKPAVLQEFHYDEDKPLTIDRTIRD